MKPDKPTCWSLGQRKVDFRAKQGVWEAHAQTPEFPITSKEEFLKARFGERAAGGMTFFQPVGSEVTGWWSRHLSHQSSASDQPGVQGLCSA